MVFINLSPTNVRRYGSGLRARGRQFVALFHRAFAFLEALSHRILHPVERRLTNDERQTVVLSLVTLSEEHPHLAGAFRRVRESVEGQFGDRHTDVAVNRELPRNVNIAILEGRGIRFAPAFFAEHPSARRHFLRDFAERRIEAAKDQAH